MERWGGRECGEGVGKVQRYRNGVHHDVCGMRRAGGQRRKGSELWNEEVGIGRWPEREELLGKSFREEIGLPMTDTGHREWL